VPTIYAGLELEATSRLPKAAVRARVTLFLMEGAGGVRWAWYCVGVSCNKVKRGAARYGPKELV
jgi:hypothetical protein